MSDEFPDEYIPNVLRSSPPPPHGPTLYACGYEVEPGEYSYYAGPSPRIQEMFECTPTENLPAVLSMLKRNGATEVLYRWEAGKWKKV